MTKKFRTISLLVISIVLVCLYVVSATYSVIINVTSKNGRSAIINHITIRDIVTDDNGSFNGLYYDIRNELDISDSEADILIDSVSLNNNLRIVLDNVVGNRLHNETRLSDREVYNLIVSGVRNDNKIDSLLAQRVIDKSDIYIRDVTDYLYDMDISVMDE